METKLYILLTCICLCIVHGQVEKSDETTPDVEVTSEDDFTTDEDVTETEKEDYTTNDPNTSVFPGENEDVTTQVQTDSTDKGYFTENPSDENTEPPLSTDDDENSFTSTTEKPDERSGSDPPSVSEPTDRNDDDDIQREPVGTESSEIGEEIERDSETSTTTTTETTTPDPQSKTNPEELCKALDGIYGELGCDYWCCGYVNVNPRIRETIMYFRGQKPVDDDCIVPGPGRYSGVKSVCTTQVWPPHSWPGQSWFAQSSSAQSCPYQRNVKSICKPPESIRPPGPFMPPGWW